MAERVDADVARRQTKKNKYARWEGRDGPNRLEPECWPVMRPTFKLKRGAKIFTIGSCFARNIERHLDDEGFDIPMRKIDLGGRSGPEASEYMNKYTPASIYQELLWTYNIMQRDGVVRDEDVDPLLLRREDERVYDLHCHSQKAESYQQAFARRQGIYQTFKEAFSSDAVVITLGMVETWWDVESNLYVHTMPYLLTRNAMPRFKFERLKFQACYDYVIKTLDLLESTGHKKYLITTSPVALVHTFTDDDILVANNYSKSVLRAVAGQVVEERDNVDYFPSYESVMLTKQGYVWEDDLAHVSYNFVGRIVKRVSENYVVSEGLPEATASFPQNANGDIELLFAGVMQYGDLAKASDIFMSLQFDPLTSANPLFHTQAARMFMQQNNRDIALAHARKAASTLSTFKREQVRVAEVLRWAGAKDEADAFLQRIFSSVANVPDSLLQVMRVATAFLPPEETLEWCSRHFTDDRAYFASKVFMADLQIELGLTEEALQSFRAATHLDPENYQPYIRLANLLIDSQRMAEAVEPLRTAAKLDPANSQLHRRFGFVLVETGNIKEALVHFAEATLLAIDDPKAHLAYARVLRRAGEIETALEEFRVAQRLDPADTTIETVITQLEKQIASAELQAAASQHIGDKDTPLSALPAETSDQPSGG